MKPVKLKRPTASGCCSSGNTNNATTSGCCSSGSANAATVSSCCCSDNTTENISGTSNKAECGCANEKDCIESSPHIQMVYSRNSPWVTGSVSTAAGPVQQVSTKLTGSDIFGSIKARWGINRNHYKVEPGIYCVGDPDSNSPVLVTANYKMTFDSLRMELSTLNVWVLVLDTKGINVWCAAGKGTFGTKELVNRIAKVNLASIVSHRSLILPQLGASGVAAHEVLRQSGFKVNYGPVRACDVKAFIENGMKADADMRTVKFTWIDRLVLTPLELVTALKTTIIIFGVLFILNAAGLSSFGFIELYALLGAVVLGTVLTPVLLPFIPGRAFSFKGWLLGFLWALSVNWINGFPGTPSYGWLVTVAYLLILPAISAYLAINFTGCSTYTSFSGVKREMQIALPLILVTMVLGILLLLVDMLLKLFV